MLMVRLQFAGPPPQSSPINIKVGAVSVKNVTKSYCFEV